MGLNHLPKTELWNFDWDRPGAEMATVKYFGIKERYFGGNILMDLFQVLDLNHTVDQPISQKSTQPLLWRSLPLSVTVVLRILHTIQKFSK